MTTDSSATEASTKERILTAVLRLVAERSLAGTSVVDIEKAAGLAPGRGGFYRHFPNKEAALHAAVDQELTKLRERYDAAVPAVDLPTELKQGLRGIADLGPLIAIVLRGADLQPEALRAMRTIIATGSASYGLENVTEAAERSGQDPTAAAVVVTMASVGFHLARHFFKGAVHGISEDAFVEALAAMVSRG